MRRRRVASALVWAVGLAATGLALVWSGRGPLAPPPLGDPARWSAWLAARDPSVAAFSLLRLVALATLGYLAAVTVLGVVLRLVGAARLAAAADRVTVAPVRRLLAGVSLGLAATVAGPAVLVPAALASQPVTTTSTTTFPPATVTMHLLAPGETTPPLPSTVAPPPAPVVLAPASLTVAPDRWTVKPGECFWTIAESVLTQASGRAPTDAEIVPYWQRLIAANRGALAHPGDPDLIFPGQVFDVPTP
jgi:hypothetical protein